MGLPINRSAGAIAGVSLLGLLLSISLIACSSTKEHAMEENELPATSSIDQAESLPIGDNGQTTTVELYGINVPIGEDWQNDGDRGTDGLWYASGYSSNAQVCVQENSMDNMPIEECELSLEEFCDGILAEYTNPEVNISQNICSIQGISCRIASASNANINGDLYNLRILVLPSENKIVSLFYAIDAATGTEGCWYLESLARQTTYTKDELTIIQNAMQERREEEEAKAKTEAEEKPLAKRLPTLPIPPARIRWGKTYRQASTSWNPPAKEGITVCTRYKQIRDFLKNDNFLQCKLYKSGRWSVHRAITLFHGRNRLCHTNKHTERRRDVQNRIRHPRWRVQAFRNRRSRILLHLRQFLCHPRYSGE